MLNDRLDARRTTPQRRLCNSLAYIHRLPDEVLVKVMRWSIGPDERKIVRVRDLAAICVRWANLFRSSPVLWAFFDSKDTLEQQHWVLKKSGSVPLDVSITFESTQLTPTYESLFKLLSTRRTRSLKVIYYQHWATSYVSSLAGESLEDLFLESGGWSGPVDASWITPQRLPTLASLHLGKITIPWHFPSFPQLKYLAIVFNNQRGEWETGFPSLQTLLSILQATQGLIELTLAAGPEDWDCTRTEEHPIVLPQLEALSLSLTGWRPFQVLECIEIPSCRDLVAHSCGDLIGDPPALQLDVPYFKTMSKRFVEPTLWYPQEQIDTLSAAHGAAWTWRDSPQAEQRLLRMYGDCDSQLLKILKCTLPLQTDEPIRVHMEPANDYDASHYVDVLRLPKVSHVVSLVLDDGEVLEDVIGHLSRPSPHDGGAVE